ncbi:MAG TPA: glycosyltransferase [Oligoflexia bacterium]|nr:glycosyltransferase [Oligoflexia bacterium]HMP48142.1 glycosyltransferase [Oligoflexia bacterium]
MALSTSSSENYFCAGNNESKPDFSPCIIVPVYRHARQILENIDLLLSHNIPLYIIDDGNEENDKKLLRELLKYSQVILLSHSENLGKGTAVFTGIRRAKADGHSHAVQIDADGQHCYLDIKKFIEEAKKNTKALIIASPVFDESAPLVRIWGRKLTTALIALETCRLDIRDGLIGFRCYPISTFVEIIDVDRIRSRMGFDPEILVRFAWKGVPVVSINSKITYPSSGHSNFRYVNDNLDLIRLHCDLIFERFFLRPAKFVFGRLLSKKNKKEHWFEKREHGSGFSLKILLFIYKLGGRRLINILLNPVMCYFFIKDVSARKYSREYLWRIWQKTGNKRYKPGTRTVFRHFSQFGDKLITSIEAWLDEYHGADIRWHNENLVTELIARGEGALVLSAHIGCLEVCRATHHHKDGLRISPLMYRQAAKKFTSFLRELNPRSEIDIISIEQIHPGVGLELKTRIDRGEFVAILADRPGPGAPERMIEVDFLGAKAYLPEGPFLLAMSLSCPVLTLFCSFNEDLGCYEAFWEEFPVERPKERIERRERIKKVVQLFASRMETYCLRTPFQWFNFFDFWRRP